MQLVDAPVIWRHLCAVLTVIDLSHSCILVDILCYISGTKKITKYKTTKKLIICIFLDGTLKIGIGQIWGST